MHALQPKHEKMSEKEVEELLQKLNIALVQLPKISSKDPALVDKVAVGDVIKIMRKDDVYYRVVVK